MSAQIRNGSKISGWSVIIFYDSNGMELQSNGSARAAWPQSGPWDWPAWHQTSLSITAPEGASGFRIRFELTAENSIVDVGQLTVSRRILKGVMFNPYVFANGISYSFAWMNWLSRDTGVKSRVLQELVDLKTKMPELNTLYILVNNVTTNGGDSLYAYPGVDPNVISSLAMFADLAYTQGLQVGIVLSTNCVISDNYPAPTGSRLSLTPGSGFPACSNHYIAEAETWYSSIIQGVEGQLASPAAIAFWEVGGNPTFGAAETPLWDGSVETNKTAGGQLCPTPDESTCFGGTKNFVGRVLPSVRTMTKRPIAFTLFALPLPDGSGGWLPPSQSTLMNFLAAVPPSAHPDFYIFSSNPWFVQSAAFIDALHLLPSHKIILGDLGIQVNNRSYWEMINPNGLTIPGEIDLQVQKVNVKNLGGWWIWSYRDEVDAGGVSTNTGLRHTDDTWADDFIQAAR